MLWVVKGLGPGGAEALLANAAAVHDRDRFEIECVYVLPYKDHLAERLEQSGVRTVCVGRRRRDPLWPFRLWTAIRSGGYGVVHVHSPLPGSVARLASLSMGRRRPRVVTTEHNSWGTFARPTRLLNRVTSAIDDEVFAVSDEVRQSIAPRLARRSSTLVHGIDIDGVPALRSERDAVRNELGIGPDQFVIGIVANFREQKDYPTFLRAVRSFIDVGGNATFVVVGQGPLEGEIRSLAGGLGLGESVLFTGYRSDAARVLSAFDIFTMTSKWEGLPVALMEACAIGLPVVATAVGGVAECLQDGVSAVLVPPGSPIETAAAWRRVADDDKLQQQLARGVADVAGRFDIRRAQAVVEGAYAKLSRPHPGSAASSVGTTQVARLSPGLDIRPFAVDDQSDVLTLMNRCLGWDDDPRYRDLFRWKHLDNPFGPSFGWVATDAGRVVAVRLFMRWQFSRGAEVLDAVRAVDTATDPDYQGRGLFTALTSHGLEAMRERGVGFVFNTPNSQSLPGYLKMGWRVVGRVPASVAVGGAGGAARLVGARVPAELWSVPLDVGIPARDWLADAPTWRHPRSEDVRSIETHRSVDFARWRYGNDLLGYRVVRVRGAEWIVRARRRGHSVELVVADPIRPDDDDSGERLPSLMRGAGCDHALRVGRSSVADGFWPLPTSGPLLTWKAVTAKAMPPLSNWSLTLGDIELF